MSTGNEKELEEKKTILQTEIIEKNYNQVKFIQFCLSKKPNGDDLNTWTLEELKSTVQEFISKNPKPDLNNQMENLNINNTANNYNDFQKDIEKMNVPSAEAPKKTQTIKIKCKVLEKSNLNDKKITVIIKNPKPVVTNLLSSNYVEYEVETKDMNWLVKRRYSDFEWLRQVLSKFNPGHMVPPLPSKKIGPRRFELDFISKRMKFLQKFIDDVMENEIFKASEPLKAFLSMSDKNQFLSKMKALASYLPSPYVNEYRTFDGEVEIDPPDEGD